MSAVPITQMLTLDIRLSIGSKKGGSTGAETFVHVTTTNASSTPASMTTEHSLPLPKLRRLRGYEQGLVLR